MPLAQNRLGQLRPRLTMEKKSQILVFQSPDGQTPDWYVGPEKILALVPGFPGRMDAVKDCFASDRVDLTKTRDLEPLCGDFFAAWATSSPVVLELLGEAKVMEILEFFAARRELTWTLDDYEYFKCLPDRVQIFRGGTGTVEDIRNGFSWSTSEAVAEQYAKQNKEGILLQAETDKEDVLLVFPLEHELVLRKNSAIIHQVIPCGVTDPEES